jgi:integrase
MASLTSGIETRHSRGCRSREGRRCSCDPTYRAEAFDRRSGQRIRKTFPTLAAARAWRSDAQREIRQGVRRGPSGLTLREAAERWLDGARSGVIRARGGHPYKPSALNGYATALTDRILPELGGAKLEDVTRGDVQAFADRLLAEGLQPSTVRGALMPLRVVYRYLLQRELVAVNPTTGLEWPRSATVRERIASPSEAAALLAALEESDRALWAAALYAGLRAGELQGLAWDQVDLGSGVIRVERAWDPKSHQFIAPKSAAGRRRVPVIPILRDLLVDQKLRGDGEGLV